MEVEFERQVTGPERGDAFPAVRPRRPRIANYWYPVMKSRTCAKRRPKALKLFGQPIMFFREKRNRVRDRRSLPAPRRTDLARPARVLRHLQLPLSRLDVRLEDRRARGSADRRSDSAIVGKAAYPPIRCGTRRHHLALLRRRNAAAGRNAYPARDAGARCRHRSAPSRPVRVTGVTAAETDSDESHGSICTATR